MATRRSPSYCVEIVGQGYHTQPFVTTLYTAKFDKATQQWWHTKLRPAADLDSSTAPVGKISDP